MNEGDQAYEIDHGAPAEPRPRPPASPPEARARRDARAEAQARIAEAVRAQHVVDLQAIALAGLCGQGLAAVTRVDSLGGGHIIGVLAASAGLAAAVAVWRRTRTPAEALLALPVPIDPAVIRRLDVDGSEGVEAERRRQESDLAAIELLAVELGLFRLRLRLALGGAVAGCLAAWAAGCSGPPGSMLAPASAACLAGSLAGWRAGGGGWTATQALRALAALIAIAAILALACGTSAAGVVIGTAAVAAAVWALRGRIAAVIAS